MKRKLTEIERLKLDNEVLKVQVDVYKSDADFYKQLSKDNVDFREISIGQILKNISLLITIKEQQEIIQILSYDAQYHSIANDISKNPYHINFQN
jgi:phage antirepressor YoqD-like protein